jgi:hypothetical protein
VCPECAYEFSANDLDEQARIIKDANGNVLKDGDSVSVIKDLKIKGTQSVVKVGTKVKNIREIIRKDAYFKQYHLHSIMDYVLTGAYKTQSNFQRYIEHKSDKLREQGITVDIWK